jgi:hypothetical protein
MRKKILTMLLLALTLQVNAKQGSGVSGNSPQDKPKDASSSNKAEGTGGTANTPITK